MPFEITKPENRKFAQVHVPRTAGISIYSYFEQAMGADKCKRYGTEAEVEELGLLSADAHRDITFLAAHAPCWELLSKLDSANTFLFTTLREPISRELSAFWYMVHQKSGPSFAHVRTFDDYLDLLESRPDLCGLQKNYLCPRYDMLDASPSHVLSRYLELGFGYVELSKIPLFQNYLTLILKKPFVIERLNKVDSLAKPEPMQLSKLAELIKDDIELYSILQERGLISLPDWRFSGTGNPG